MLIKLFHTLVYFKPRESAIDLASSAFAESPICTPHEDVYDFADFLSGILLVMIP